MHCCLPRHSKAEAFITMGNTPSKSAITPCNKMMALYVQFRTLQAPFARHRSNKILTASTPGPGRSAQKWRPDPAADPRAHCDSPAHPKRRTHKNQKMSNSKQLLPVE